MVSGANLGRFVVSDTGAGVARNGYETRGREVLVSVRDSDKCRARENLEIQS